MKRCIAFLLTLVLGLSSLNMLCYGADETEVECNYTFKINDTQDGYILASCTINASGRVDLPGVYNHLPVTGIGEKAFGNCADITEVFLPGSYVMVDETAFEGCEAIKYVFTEASQEELSASGVELEKSFCDTAVIHYGTRDHMLSEWNVTAEPTVHAVGQRQRSCSVCDYMQSEAIAQLKPARPELLSVTNTTGGILFKWKSVEGADAYRVYKRGAGDRYWTYLGTVNETSYNDPKVASGKYYRYTAIAVNEGGYSTFHSGLVVKRLANPYKIKAVNNTDSVTVTWSRINGANGYRVYRRGAGSRYWTYLGTVSALSYTDKNVVNGAYYRYTVRAAYGYTYSDFSTAGSVTMFLSTPRPMRIVTSETGLSFSWESVPKAHKYRVYRRGAGERYWTYLGDTANTSYFDKNLKKGAYYRYTVRAVCGSYYSSFDSVGITLKYSGVNGQVIHGRYDNYLKPGSITDPTIISIDKANWELTIVNRGYRIPATYKPDLVYVCGSNQRLDRNVAAHYERMYYAAKSEGINLTPCSGYRSYSTQEELFNRKINLYLNQGYSYNDAVVKAATIVMPPGSSEHNLGYAMDIVCVEEWFERTPEFRWLQENAADYGFIMRYPKNKQHITNVIYEPWHWRYVGVTAARAMKESGLVLEEYLGVVE